MRKLWLVLYYSIAWRFPTQPMPGYKFGYALRRFLVKRLFASCGDGVIVKQRAYFGDGGTLRIGHRSQIGANSRIDREVTLGNDIVMGPDVVIMTIGHEFRAVDVPINRQGGTERRPVRIGNDVWLGTRVIVLPGVEIGDGTVVGAGSVVTKSLPAMSVAAGVPAKVIRPRGSAA